MRTILQSMEVRLHAFARKLGERGLRFPESQRTPGLPNILAVARFIDANESTFGLRHGVPSPARVLLEKLSTELGLMPYDEFQERTRGDSDLFVSSRTEDTTYQALQVWIENTRRAALKVPEKPNSLGEPFYRAIAKAAGIDEVRLASSAYVYRETVDAFAAEVGFMPVEDYARCAGIDLRSQHRIQAEAKRCDRIRQYIYDRHLKAPAIGLPEAKHRKGTPNYRVVCQNAGTDFRGANADRVVMELIDEAAQIVGVGEDHYRPVIQPNALTYGDFLRRGLDRYRFEHPSASKSSIERFASALRKWQSHHGRTALDRLGEDFGATYQEQVSIIAGTLSNTDTRRHWLSAMARWYGYFQATTSDDVSLPESFSGALTALRRRSRFKSLVEGLKLVGLDRHANAVRQWERGTREPVQTDKTLIQGIERLYEVEPGTLTKRVRKFFRVSVADLRVDAWPPSLDTSDLRRLAKPLLPDNFAHLSDDEREAIGLSIRAEAQTTIPFRLRMRALEKWRIPVMPAHIQAEWAELVEYKTCLLPQQPRASTWSEGSVSRNWGIVSEFLSALALDPTRGGLGVKPEHLTLALCGSAKLIKWFAHWKFGKGQIDTGARTWLGFLSHIAAPEAKDVNGRGEEAQGYLHYARHWTQRLQPIPGYLTADEVQLLKTPEGWSHALASASDTAARIFKRVRGEMRLARDPFEPIMPILDMDRPYDALIVMLRAAYEALPDPRRTGEYRRAVAVRQFVMALIFVRTALRRKNVAKLTYSDDGRGQMRRLADGWRIEINAKHFKNKDGPFFRTRQVGGRAHNFYVFDFFDDGDNAILDEYVNVSRKVLSRRAKKPSDAFLLSVKGEALTDDHLSNDMHDMTWRYIVYHEVTGTGIKGVEYFGPHAIRDIVATHLLKTTGDISLAADALQDSVSTVLLHYARFLTSDRTRRVNEVLRQGTPTSNWGTRLPLAA